MILNDLSDESWLVLDLLMRAREKGVHRLNRLELLSAPQIPQAARMRLTFAALAMPKELVSWVGEHDFSITDQGIAAYQMRFRAQASDVADAVICLPGPEHYRN
jgi:hypothetical protein